MKRNDQPEKQTASGRAAIEEQRLELRLLLENDTLKNHAVKLLADAYVDAQTRASHETEMKLGRLPKECAWDVGDLLTDD